MGLAQRNFQEYPSLEREEHSHFLVFLWFFQNVKQAESLNNLRNLKKTIIEKNKARHSWKTGYY